MKYEVYEETLTQHDGSNAKLIQSNLSFDEAEKLKSEGPNRVIVPQVINGS